MSEDQDDRDDQDDEDDRGPVRLDKWLWAARFYRTRSIAKQAIESGHVRYEGDRAKVGRAVRVGAVLVVRQGWDEREVIVRGLSAQRGGAPQAQQLYEETADSLRRREEARLIRKSGPSFDPVRPDKKQRREGSRFKRGGE
ncbi:MAG: RNA-binding S4 domain-containing protein [Panacagrimonas sp.]